ncbi:hypothetical protein WAI453_005099 [Rhynchosporium graminicola]
MHACVEASSTSILESFWRRATKHFCVLRERPLTYLASLHVAFNSQHNFKQCFIVLRRFLLRLALYLSEILVPQLTHGVGSFSFFYLPAILQLPLLILPVGQKPYDSPNSGINEYMPIEELALL